MLKKYIYLIMTGLIFGSQFILTKFALDGYSPLDIGFMRVLFGMLAVALLTPLFTKKEKEKGEKRIRWYHYAIIGFFEGTLPCFLVPWGQAHVATTIAAVIITTMPIFAMLLGPLLIKNERLHIIDVASILIGFIGVFILIHPPSGSSWLTNMPFELAILLASASWAFSLILIKKLPHQHPFKLTRNILIAATIEIIPLWLIFSKPLELQFAFIPLISAILLGIFGSGIVYVFYVLLIRAGGVNFAAFSNYLVPVVAGIIGILFLHESFNTYELIGFIIIIAALVIHSFHPNNRSPTTKKSRD